MGAAPEEPEWLTSYRARAPAEDVAEAWVKGLGPEEKRQAEADAPAARASLRRAIVDSECPEVRADAADGWRYTGSVLRAADAALGIKPPVSRTRAPGAASGSGAPNVSRVVVPGDGSPGTLAIWWSDFGAASNTQQLRQHGITRRLNVAVEAVGRLPDDGIPTTDVPMEDVFDDNRAPDAIVTWVVQLREAIGILRQWREEGAVVNINCQMGKNRSGAVALAWLCSECGRDLGEATDQLRSITALACGNPHILKAVADFLEVDTVVPLNPAGDGGGWVCISPPGTPRAGGTPDYEDVTRLAFERIAREAAGGAGASAAAGPVKAPAAVAQLEEQSENGNIAPLFGELSDVD